MTDIQSMIAWVGGQLEVRADPNRAAAMAAYMKTSMPFYGVGRPEQKVILRELRKRFPAESAADHEGAVRALWALPHREEKYLAIDLAQDRRFITFEHLELYRRFIVEGAWWDFVDPVAARLVGKVLADRRDETGPVMWEWIEHENLWLRRSAILSQLSHKEATDADMLFAFCLARAEEKEFFIRKAIGWALRQYARVAPDEVRAFLTEHRERLSGLSYREAAKHLGMPG